MQDYYSYTVECQFINVKVPSSEFASLFLVIIKPAESQDWKEDNLEHLCLSPYFSQN